MSIGIGSNYSVDAALAQAESSKSTSKIEDTLNKNLKNASDDELMDVCKSFESYMVEQMFKEMKKSVGSEEDESPYVSYFGDTLYQKYAEDVVDTGSMGIAQMLYDSMKHNS
ncbi:Rod binding protein [Anaerocolumna jejuensis DSM 15929]|uniref:Rod binding protein n=1 Tax=Anaerocolumna jejuensis DSM 15929 TaxID=1121322 RepID=A0A1M7C2U6_9FIRM|nr:rod-binding protein [Anaerocolumna jejuensis]SHL61555.1 Rod binding protein [Anaerocolumna jejuensis DSM 15929]